MCRMCVVMTCNPEGVLLADVVTKPSMSIIKQSFCSQERAKLPPGRLPNLSYEQSFLNGDGYGVGWYTPFCCDGTPCVFTSTKPAWNDPNVENLADKIRSPVVLAHVRAAGPGTPVGEGTCHPFRAGRFLWMHNGLLGGFSKTQRTLINLLDLPSFDLAMKHSAIDSIVAFSLFLTNLVEANPDRGGWNGKYTSVEILETLEKTVQIICNTNAACGVTAPSLLNFVVTDGIVVLATRVVDHPPEEDFSSASSCSDSGSSSKEVPEVCAAASLYLSTGSSWEPKTSSTSDYSMQQEDRRNRTVIITSEPLSSTRDDWVPIPANHFVLCSLRQHIDVTFVPFPQKSKHVTPMIDLLRTRYEVECADEPGDTIEMEVTMSFRENETSTVTCLTSCRGGEFLVSGSRDGAVVVWDTKLAKPTEPRRHPGPVLSLLVDDSSPERDPLLFSSSSSELRVWDLTETVNRMPGAEVKGLSCLYAFKFLPTRGKLLSICGDAAGLYLGFQAPSILFLRFWEHRSDLAKLKTRSKSIKFLTVDLRKVGGVGSVHRGHRFRPEWMVESLGAAEQHNGFVYDMCLFENSTKLVSAGGDGRLLIWKERKLVGALVGHTGAVMSVTRYHDRVISGSFDSTIREWCLKDRSCVRTLRYSSFAPVMSVVACQNLLFSVVVERGKFQLSCWELQEGDKMGAVHHAAELLEQGDPVLAKGVHVLGIKDGRATVALDGEQGRIIRIVTLIIPGPRQEKNKTPLGRVLYDNDILRLLQEFVAFPSVSTDLACKMACDAAARWVTNQFEMMGCTVMAHSLPSTNPVILARLGWDPALPTIVLYSHYDVVPDSEGESPWELRGIDGYVYGRGVSDNKGPALAQIVAVRKLQAAGKLNLNVLFICEGDEEAKETGCLLEALQHARQSGWLEGVVGGIVTNSTWIDEEHPSLCYGSRGVLDFTVTVSGPLRDLHAGTHGGLVSEPLHDLMSICGQLVDSTGHVFIPDFYDGVKPPQPYDEEALLAVARVMDVPKMQQSMGIPGFRGVQGKWTASLDTSMSLLRDNWLQPSLCVTEVHTAKGSSGEGKLFLTRSISRSATAYISIRTVPGQEGEKLSKSIKQYLTYEFSRRRSHNTLQVETTCCLPWWEGDSSSLLFKACGDAIERVWGVKPLNVREGGTMSVLSVIQSYVGVPMVQLPLGQSADRAHLPNERIRLENLYKGVDIVAEALSLVADRIPSTKVP